MTTVYRLSVVIPHLNEPEELKRCLASIIRQREPDFPIEIIVVDNGSIPMPRRICDPLDDVKLLLERVPGPGPARNKGAAIASSDLIAFIDADCTAAQGWARAIVSAFEADETIDFAGGEIHIRPVRAEKLTAIEAYELVLAYRNDRYVRDYGFSATGNMSVRKRVFEAVGPFGGIGTMEDTDWGMKASREGYRIAFIRDAKVLTPPCANFDELALRWDRHVAHEFKTVPRTLSGKLKWAAKALAVAASPIQGAVQLAKTDRLVGLRERFLGFVCLTRVRLYRARRMLGLIVNDESADMVGSWNRENS